MADHDFEATVETDAGTFTMRGDNPRIVSAQAARMPVLMHRKQIETRTDLGRSIQNYLEYIARQEQRMRNNMKPDHERLR